MRDIRVEKCGKNRFLVKVSVSPEMLESGMQAAFEKNQHNYQIEGYEDGCAPRAAIEAVHGPYVFLEDGINEILPGIWERTVAATGLDIVSAPKIEMEPVELKKGLAFTAEVYIRPEVVLGQYTGLDIPEDDTEDTLIKQITENASIEEMPECMVDQEVDAMMEEFAYQLQQQGMQLSDYFKTIDTTEEAFRQLVRGDAYDRIKTRMVLEQIADAELLVVTDAEVSSEIQDMLRAYGLQDDSRIDDKAREVIRKDLLRKKALKFVIDAN